MYVGIAQAPGAVDVIDTVSLTNAKSIAVKGAIHKSLSGILCVGHNMRSLHAPQTENLCH